jgi:hypothetical protein
MNKRVTRRGRKKILIERIFREIVGREMTQKERRVLLGKRKKTGNAKMTHQSLLGRMIRSRRVRSLPIGDGGLIANLRNTEGSSVASLP